jgi:hypothetical protein
MTVIETPDGLLQDAFCSIAGASLEVWMREFCATSPAFNLPLANP